MIYLELDSLLAIASEVLGLEVDVLTGATDLGLAESALGRPQASFAGYEPYRSMAEKAATLLYGISRNHPFLDGNKRVAVLACLHFLNLNGKDLDLSPPEEAYKIIAGTAAGYVDLAELTQWIDRRIRDLNA